MSVLKNEAGLIVPIRESRRSTSAALAANGAQLVHDVNGDQSAMLYLNSNGVTFNGTYEVSGSADGVNFFPILAFPHVPGCSGGTIPQAAQPLIAEAINANCIRALAMATGQLRKVRVRLTALTGGSIVPTFTSDELPSMHPNVAAQRAGTLAATAVSASVGAAATATLAAVTGLRHYVDFVAVTRSAAALLTAGATPATVTTTNIAGSPALTFGSDAAAQGVDTTREIDFGSSGMAATAAGAATTVVCPATPNVIWRVTVAYRLGL